MPLQQQRADRPSGRVVRWLRHLQAVFGIWAKINDVNDLVYMNLRCMLMLVVLWVCEPGHVWMQRNQTFATLRTQLPYLYDIPFRPIYLLCRNGAACMTGTQGIDPQIYLQWLAHTQVVLSWVCSNCHRDGRHRQIDQYSHGKLRAL
jgi:hypothetical protein